jgi:cytochrome oxidase assembly protein ShyY1
MAFDSSRSPRHAAAPAGARRVALVPTLAAVVVVATTVSLGHWQLRRADEKRAMQAERDAAERADPVALPVPAPGAADTAGLVGRRVLARGRFVPERTVFIDNRTHKGVAGLHVVTPVRLDGSDAHVLVLRGWVARDARDWSRLPVVRTPEGPVAIEGLAQAGLAHALELSSTPAPGPADRVWQNLDYERYERWSGLPVLRLLVRQSAQPPVDDGLVRDWPVPGNDVDMHRGYAFQWYALAAACAALWIWFTFFRRREHRADPA